MRAPRRFGVSLLALALVWSLRTTPALAWGATGHHIIARIALGLLSPEALQETRALLGGDEQFVALSTWADSIRRDHPETANWHFVDIPYGEAHYSAERDCRPADGGDCVIAEIERAQAALADVHRPRPEREDALKYLIHFVGDFHQPLHNIGNLDRGGNDVHIAAVEGVDLGSRTSNLHSVWDSMVIEQRGMDEAAYTAYLMEDLKAHPVEVDKVDLVGWSEQAHALAEQFAYSYAGFSSAGPPAAPIALDRAYMQRARPVVDRQLQLAGARLAAVLNQCLGRPVRLPETH